MQAKAVNSGVRAMFINRQLILAYIMLIDTIGSHDLARG